MPTEIGEARETWARDVCLMVEDFVNNMKHETEPFYVVYYGRKDKVESNKLNTPIFRQAIKAYRNKPPKMLGILVWYADNSKGIFEFKPELSFPPDIPIDPSMLSNKSEDSFGDIMKKGQEINVLLS